MKAKLHPLFFGGIAHRGLHDESIMENSLGAFAKAAEAGMAIELDVHLTKDGHLLVCHDFSLLRVTGKEGEIEKLTLKEIQDDYRLLDGQAIPTLEEVLALVDERVPIVIELKASSRNALQIGHAARKALRNVPDPSKYCFISFDPRAILARGRFKRGLLICKERQDILAFRYAFDFIDVESCLATHPKVIEYRKRGWVNVWTVRDEETLSFVLPFADMVTFEHLPPSRIREDLCPKN